MPSVIQLFILGTVVFSTTLIYYFVTMGLPTMFLLHVVGMTAAFLAAAPIGIFLKKLPGNTQVHGYCMSLGTCELTVKKINMLALLVVGCCRNC